MFYILYSYKLIFIVTYCYMIRNITKKQLNSYFFKLAKTVSLYGNKTRDQLNQLFQQYLQKVGFPEVIKYSPDIRQQTLQDYVEIVLYRDIIER